MLKKEGRRCRQPLIQTPDFKESEPFRRPTQARGQTKFDRILDAAHNLLEEKGIGEFGLRDVARKAGVATGSVYHFFSNNEPLFVALVERYDKAFVELVSEPVDAANVDIAAAIASSLDTFFEMPSSPPPDEVLHIGVRILEGIWELSVQQYGRVTDDLSHETTRAVVAYLGL